MINQVHKIKAGTTRFWVEQNIFSGGIYTLVFVSLTPPEGKITEIDLTKNDLAKVTEVLNKVLGWEDNPQEYTLQSVEDFNPKGQSGTVGPIGDRGVNDDSE